MVYVEAPQEYDGDLPAVFLAGGITDCPLWQPDAVAALDSARLAVFNPRRAAFPMDDPAPAGTPMRSGVAGRHLAAQIEWEFRHLRRAAVVLFWFACGPSPQPITLYELGTQAATGRPVAVGCDPAYVRRADVVHQLALLRPDVTVSASLGQTCATALDLLRSAIG
jgi:hypothetical protein